jgi:hypothetical protein
LVRPDAEIIGTHFGHDNRPKQSKASAIGRVGRRIRRHAFALAGRGYVDVGKQWPAAKDCQPETQARQAFSVRAALFRQQHGKPLFRGFTGSELPSNRAKAGTAKLFNGSRANNDDLKAVHLPLRGRVGMGHGIIRSQHLDAQLLAQCSFGVL